MSKKTALVSPTVILKLGNKKVKLTHEDLCALSNKLNSYLGSRVSYWPFSFNYLPNTTDNIITNSTLVNNYSNKRKSKSIQIISEKETKNE